jgi:hypothetical protein
MNIFFFPQVSYFSFFFFFIKKKHNYFGMAALLQTLAKWAIPVGLVVGGAQSAMYDGKLFF